MKCTWARAASAESEVSGGHHHRVPLKKKPDVVPRTLEARLTQDEACCLFRPGSTASAARKQNTPHPLTVRACVSANIVTLYAQISQCTAGNININVDSIPAVPSMQPLPGLDWFNNRPVWGKDILTYQSREVAGGLLKAEATGNSRKQLGWICLTILTNSNAKAH